MKVRNLARLLADRIPGWKAEIHRRKATDYGAILVGVAMMGAMHANTPMLDDSTVFAAAGTPPSQATSANLDSADGNTPKIAIQSAAPTSQSQTSPPQTEAKAAPTPDQATTTPTPIPTDARAQTSARSGRPAATPQPTTPAERFIAQNAEAATQSMQETGVPASVTLAQAVLESDSGRSGLSVKAKNYFGIKASAKPGPAGVVYMDTWEHVGGQDLTISQPFRAYHNAEESFADHGKYLRENSRYAEAMKHTDDARAFARLIHQAGYATDPAYASKLIGLMDRYNLYQYDK
ncbi:MAG: glucosaminidase domain-containing protein [Chloroflexota bacterium]